MQQAMGFGTKTPHSSSVEEVEGRKWIRVYKPIELFLFCFLPLLLPNV